MIKMITVIKKMISVIGWHTASFFAIHHCNHRIHKLLQRNHCNHDHTHRSCKKGQSIIEYATFIAVMVMALLAMQVYLKRGLQGYIKDYADQISPALYNPNTTEANYSTNTTSRAETNYTKGIFRSELVFEQTNRSGVEVVYPEWK